MWQTEDEWIATTTSPEDFCAGCHAHLTWCACDTRPTCIYCGEPFEDEAHSPYCSPLCAIDAEMEERR
jgi:hypothetical protein